MNIFIYIPYNMYTHMSHINVIFLVSSLSLTNREPNINCLITGNLYFPTCTVAKSFARDLQLATESDRDSINISLSFHYVSIFDY